MAKKRKPELKYVVEDGGEMSEQDMDIIAELLAQIIFDQIQHDAHKDITKSQNGKKSA